MINTLLALMPPFNRKEMSQSGGLRTTPKQESEINRKASLA
jgi:hypothetical protein